MKYLYIDLPEHSHADGFKNLNSLEIGDELEVSLYELGDNLDRLIQSLEWRTHRLKAKIEIQFMTGGTHIGYQIIKIVPIK